MRKTFSRMVARPELWSLAFAAWMACGSGQESGGNAAAPDAGAGAGGSSGISTTSSAAGATGTGSASSAAGGAGKGGSSSALGGSTSGTGGASSSQSSAGTTKSTGTGGAGGTGGTTTQASGGTSEPRTSGTGTGGKGGAGSSVTSGAGGDSKDAGVGGTGGAGADAGGGTTTLADGGAGTSPDANSSLPRDGGSSSCSVLKAGPFAVRAARSAGWQGTLSDYSSLYNVSCSNLDPCVSSCTQSGGTKESCTAGSECITGTDPHCLPPTYWRYEDKALAADGDTAEQTIVKINYQDPLLLRDFGVTLPTGAAIRGIQFDVLRSSLTENEIVDYAVRVMRNGQPVGEDKKLSGTWPTTLTYAIYGGPSDTWGVSWTPADLTSAQFGLSFATLYTLTAGNTRAYVDFARVWIYYTQGSCL